MAMRVAERKARWASERAAIREALPPRWVARVRRVQRGIYSTPSITRKDMDWTILVQAGDISIGWWPSRLWRKAESEPRAECAARNAA